MLAPAAPEAVVSLAPVTGEVAVPLVLHAGDAIAPASSGLVAVPGSLPPPQQVARQMRLLAGDIDRPLFGLR